MDEITYKPIGIIHTSFRSTSEVPKESKDVNLAKGTIEVAPQYAEGLRDIEGFSHLFVIFHFHLSRDYPLLVKPHRDDKLRGVFATRSPARPNPIGLSVVRLTKREGNILSIQGADMVDGTPVLDIKPYVPQFGQEGILKVGWLERHLESRRGRP